jgi:hypothetical protein
MRDSTIPISTDAFYESPTVKHNCVGTPYSVKLVYPGFYNEIDLDSKTFSVGFPKSKRALADKVEIGHLFFIYVTAPEKWIIGLARVLRPAIESQNQNCKRPLKVPMEWVVGPKRAGVKFVDVDLVVRPRIGDSLYAIGLQDALRLLRRLRELPDVTSDDLERKIATYSKITPR